MSFTTRRSTYCLKRPRRREHRTVTNEMNWPSGFFSILAWIISSRRSTSGPSWTNTIKVLRVTSATSSEPKKHFRSR